MKNNKGFSLVELIVVIAIMAVLAAVAVIGVSVYIPKAQQAADQQMVADIQKAIDLYAQLEGAELQPGQSGYVVIKKTDSNGGGAISFVVMPVGAEDDVVDADPSADPNKKTAGNVTTGGTMNEDQFLHNALVNYFGADYGTELKVSYGEWTGSLSVEDATSVNNSSYIRDPADLMETVEVLTDALTAFYTGSVPDPQKQANQSVLDVAKDTGAYVDKDKFITWWMNSNLLDDEPYTYDAFKFPDGSDAMGNIKTQLAAKYAKYKAIVMYTGCETCMTIYGNPEAFQDVADGNAAVAALDNILTQTYEHAAGADPCPTCSVALETYFTEQGPAKADAQAYLAMLGEIDDLSGTIGTNPGFSSDNFYNSEFIGGIMNDYVTEVKAYAAANVREGDIVISVISDQKGNITYKVNIHN